MNFHRDPLKDIKIRQDPGRNGVWFDDVVDAIKSWWFYEIIDHQKQDMYPWQRIIILQIDWYIYHVPCRIDGNDYYLITLFPSRKSTKKYL